MSEKILEDAAKNAIKHEETQNDNSKELTQLVADISREISLENKSEGNEIDDDDNLDSNEKVAKVVARVMQREFRGPIPSPDILAGYESISPGFADRIIVMAEKQSKHRQEIEKTQVNSESRDSLLGVIFAFVLGIGSLFGCVVMVLCIPNSAGAISGVVLGVTGISAIVGTFLKNTRKQTKDD